MGSAATDGKDLVVGLGSPHGDDAAGWRAAELLRGRVPPGVRVVAVGEPTRLLDLLAGVRRLWVVDAWRAEGRSRPERIRWPEAVFAGCGRGSSHGWGLAEVLRLAEAVGRLPPEVVLVGIPIGRAEAGACLSVEVEALAREAADELAAELAGPRGG